MTETVDLAVLTAVLAAQMGLAAPVPLAMAVFDWASDPSRSIGAVLVGRGVLAASDVGPLETLAGRLVARHGGRADLALAEAATSARPEVVEALSRVPDPMVRAALGRPRDGRGASGLEAGAGLEVEPRATPRYRVVGVDRRVGDDVLAIDLEFGREVVVRVPRPVGGGEGRDVAESRFLAEARVLGRLDHPGIVPIFDAGRLADGRVFFVVRPERGRSLREAIEEYHNPPGPAPARGPRALALRGLVGRLSAACRAVAHAHARGIIHRNLNPLRILLGDHGETRVTGWDLACPWGPDAPWSPDEPSDPIIGNPSFLSPEQAAGLPFGPSSDVYSLGATLYFLLAGRPSITFRNPFAFLEDLRAGRYPPPRSVRPDIPRPLERICLKAMSLRPEDRHPTASALADDLDLWLAGLPTSADPPRWWRRTR